MTWWESNGADAAANAVFVGEMEWNQVELMKKTSQNAGHLYVLNAGGSQQTGLTR